MNASQILNHTSYEVPHSHISNHDRDGVEVECIHPKHILGVRSIPILRQQTLQLANTGRTTRGTIVIVGSRDRASLRIMLLPLEQQQTNTVVLFCLICLCFKKTNQQLSVTYKSQRQNSRRILPRVNQLYRRGRLLWVITPGISILLRWEELPTHSDVLTPSLEPQTHILVLKQYVGNGAILIKMLILGNVVENISWTGPTKGT